VPGSGVTPKAERCIGWHGAGDDGEWRLVNPDEQLVEQHGTCAALFDQH